MDFSDDDSTADVSDVVRYTVPKLKSWSSSQLYYYEDIVSDYESI